MIFLILKVHRNYLESQSAVTLTNHKSTYPALLTLKGAKDKLSEQIQLAHSALAATKLPTTILGELTDIIANRNH